MQWSRPKPCRLFWPFFLHISQVIVSLSSLTSISLYRHGIFYLPLVELRITWSSFKTIQVFSGQYSRSGMGKKLECRVCMYVVFNYQWDTYWCGLSLDVDTPQACGTIPSQEIGFNKNIFSGTNPQALCAHLYRGHIGLAHFDFKEPCSKLSTWTLWW